ncbi:MAG: isopeptide-forming domain-containing fimbrial protein, partial [Atopobiaceae bacterium]|nr:isopeptide-forming domain-containing fimbrial protein [Atopobiaceae bacterium]
VTELSDGQAIENWTLNVAGSTTAGTPAVELGKTAEFELVNDYTQDKGAVKVTKAFTGVAALPEGFQITNDYNDAVFTVANAVGGSGTAAEPYYWVISDVPVNKKVKFIESGAGIDGYELVATAVPANYTSEAVVKDQTKVVNIENIYEKKPTFEKKIKDRNDSTGEVTMGKDAQGNDTEWIDSADYDIGDAVPFKLTAKLSNVVTSYKNYQITFTDEMENTLTFDKNSVEVYLSSRKLNADEYELDKISDHKFTVTLAWHGEGQGESQQKIADTALNGATVDVFFSARLDENANLGKKGNVNGAKLTYSSNPKSDETEDTPWDYVIAFTYKTVINKVDDKGEPLKGAAFQLFKVKATPTETELEEPAYCIKVGDVYYQTLDGADLAHEGTWDENTTTFAFKGLDDGTYVLRESQVPKGCKAIDPIAFTVTANHDVVWNVNSTDEDATFELDGRTTVLKTLEGTEVKGETQDGKLTLTADDALAKLTGDLKNENADKPKFDKKIQDVNDSTGLYTNSSGQQVSELSEATWIDSADYDIGDSIPFRLRAQLPSDLSAYKGYHLTFIDRMEKGLTLDLDSIKVKISGDQDYMDSSEDSREYQLSYGRGDDIDDNFALTIRWGEQKPENWSLAEGATVVTDTTHQLENLVGATVEVFFSATLNDKFAKIGEQGNINAAKLTFTNNVNQDGKGQPYEEEKPWDYVIAFTYKVDVNKVTPDGHPRKGAKFTMQKVKATPVAEADKVAGKTYVEANGQYYEWLKDLEFANAWTEDTTTFSYKGLDDGTYVLTETEAPVGYQLIDPIVITVTADHKVLWDYTSITTIPDFYPETPARNTVLQNLLGNMAAGDKAEGEIVFAPAAEPLPANAVVNEEHEKPTFEKKIQDVNDSNGKYTDKNGNDVEETSADTWIDSADYDIYDHVPYKLTAKLPGDVTNYKQYHITFTDQMEKSLTYDKNARVEITDKDGEPIDYDEAKIEKSEHDHDFALTLRWAGAQIGTDEQTQQPICDRISASELNGATVNVYFTATLNESAKIGAAGNVNTAKLTYSNNSNKDDEESDTEDTPWDSVIAFTYQVDVNKFDGDDEPLEGARFQLYKKYADTNVEGRDSEGFAPVGDAIEGTGAGKNLFNWKGLDDGDYKIVETFVPTGKKRVDPITFTVTADHNVVWTDNAAWRGDVAAEGEDEGFLVHAEGRGAILQALTPNGSDKAEGKVVFKAAEGNLPANAVVNEEHEKPSFDKKIKDVNDSTGEVTTDDPGTKRPASFWIDSADYDIGDPVPFRLRAKLPSDVNEYKGYHLTFTDQMEKGLTFKRDSVKVMVGGTELTPGQYEFDCTTGDDIEDSFVLTVRWSEQQLTEALNGAYVEVFFEAELNENANLGRRGNVNGAKLTFTDSVNGDGENAPVDEKPWDYVIAFTYEVDVNKVDPEKKALAGAEFKLEKLYKGVDGADDEYRLVKAYAITDENQPTTFEFTGLDDGIYKLTETHAPKGFKLIDPITFTVTADHEVEWDASSDADKAATFDLDGRTAVLTNLTGNEETGKLALTADEPKAKLSGDLVNDELEKPKFEKKIADSNDSKAEEAIAGDVTSDKLADLADGRWQDSADYDIGDNVPFRLKATLPSDITEYKQYHVTFVDQMETVEDDGAKFKYDGDYTVKVFEADGTTEIPSTEYTVSAPEEKQTEDSFEVKVTWGDGTAKLPTKLAGAKVCLYFTAELTNKANIGSQGNVNAAKLRYTYDVNQDGEGKPEEEKPWDYVIAFTYQLDVNKLTEDEQPLEGAEFTLQKKLADGTLDSYEVHNTDNVFTVTGIDDGDYVLTETKAPTGYKAIDPVEFTVTADHKVEWPYESPATSDPVMSPTEPQLERTTILSDLNGKVAEGAIELTFTKEADNSKLATNVIDHEIRDLSLTKKLDASIANDETALATEFRYTIAVTDVPAWYDEGDFTVETNNGEATFAYDEAAKTWTTNATLKANETITYVGLPKGAKYTVTEAADPNYGVVKIAVDGKDVTVVKNGAASSTTTGTLDGEDATAPATVEYTNASVSSLMVAKA